MSHDNRLDGIRGLAVLLVLFHHALQDVPIRNPLDFVTYSASGICWVGVDLFFVLSGFLITGILLRNRNQSRYFRSFYARRILRIFPLYFLLLPVILLLAAHYGGGWPRDAWFDALYLSNVHNAIYGWPSRFASHLWSLSVEEQFYIVWPLLVFLVPLRWIVPSLIVLAGAVVCSRVAASEHSSAAAIYNLFHLDGLLIGALLAAADYRGVQIQRGVFMSVLCGSVFLLAFPPQLAIGLDWQHWKGWQTVSYSLLAIAGAATIGMTRRSAASAWISRLFASEFMTAFGRFSYAIYLVHYPLDTWIRKLGLHPGVEGWAASLSPAPTLLYAVVLGAVSFAISQLTWNLVEKRCLALKRYFEYAG